MALDLARFGGGGKKVTKRSRNQQQQQQQQPGGGGSGGGSLKVSVAAYEKQYGAGSAAKALKSGIGNVTVTLHSGGRSFLTFARPGAAVRSIFGPGSKSQRKQR